MIKNYFKIALRKLGRNKTYAAINITGLAVGIAVCLVIFLVIQYELSFDNFHPEKERIFRVVTEIKRPEGNDYTMGVPYALPQALRIDFPQLKNVTAIQDRRNSQITIINASGEPGKKFREERTVFYAEPTLFNIFYFKWLAGNPKKSLSEPNTAVLTRNMAEKYFGDWRTAIGKTFKLDNRLLIRVSGILENPPSNTDLPLKVVISYKTLMNRVDMNDWLSITGSHNCFMLLPPGLTASRFNTLLLAFGKKHKPADRLFETHVLQSLGDLHFDTRYENFPRRTVSRQLINALALIAVFILIIACVNFINLATAQAFNRSKEVGVKKVLGSSRNQLALQFLGETAIITVFAVIVAAIIAITTLAYVNRLLTLPLRFNITENPAILLFLLVISLVVTVLAGLYPSLILSGFDPITALKNKVRATSKAGLSLRRSLVVLQFSIAQVLIIGMFVILGQLSYFRNASLGFDKQAIVNIPVPSDSISRTKIDFLRNQLLKLAGISHVSFSFSSPANIANWYSNFTYDRAINEPDLAANLKWADADFFKTYNLQFISGRPFVNSDSLREFVVNETFVSKLGIKDPRDVIGKEINFWDGDKVAPIVGVVKDFHNQSLRQGIDPVVIGSFKETYQTVGIKLQAGDIRKTLASIEQQWNAAFPDNIYEYEFLDERVAAFYQQENQLAQLYKIFAAIAIFISCLGLYGLVSFMAVQRTREVGIRKVLGASVASIVYLFSREFSVLIIIAFTIATPVAYYLMHQWLQDFTFRIELGSGVFLITIIVSLVISWITVGYKAIGAAVANPVKSLRTE
ncbi:MAG: ABC transporter permease [Chitinophagaceae bacterium]